MSFSAILGQVHVTEYLKRLLASGRLPHALLFSGPEGVGKRSTAFELAKAVNCTNPNDSGACDTCSACRRIAAQAHPDFRVISPIGASNTIQTEQMDELTADANLKPFESGWKVFIIEQADRLHHQAYSKFLKTLEEPPAYCLFILVTANPALLHETIKSRCQEIRFKPLEEDVIALLLERHFGYSREKATLVAHMAEGRLDIAARLGGSDLREKVVQWLQELLRWESDAADLSQQIMSKLKTLAGAESEDGEDGGSLRRWMREFLTLTLFIARDMILLREGSGESLLINRDYIDVLRGLLTQIKANELERFITAIEDARLQLESNVIGQRIVFHVCDAAGSIARAAAVSGAVTR